MTQQPDTDGCIAFAFIISWFGIACFVGSRLVTAIEAWALAIACCLLAFGIMMSAILYRVWWNWKHRDD